MKNRNKQRASTVTNLVLLICGLSLPLGDTYGQNSISTIKKINKKTHALTVNEVVPAIDETKKIPQNIKPQSTNKTEARKKVLAKKNKNTSPQKKQVQKNLTAPVKGPETDTLNLNPTNWKIKESWVSRHLNAGGSLAPLTGLVRPQNWEQDATFNDISPVDDLPLAFNWGDKHQLQPIRRQQCGDCWAQATTNVVESLYWIKYPEVRNTVHGSVQAVIDCSGSGSCNGGYFSAMNYFMKSGDPYADEYPYKGRNQRCPGKFSEPLLKVANWAYVGTNGKSPTTEQIKSAVMTYGPVSVDIRADRNLGNYGGGVFTSCGGTSTNHMVVIEGWVDDEKYKANGGGYWVVRNSWGTSWGEGGYFKIVYKSKSGSKCNGIGGTTAYAVIN